MSEILDTHRQRFPWLLLIAAAAIAVGIVQLRTDDSAEPAAAASASSLHGITTPRKSGALYFTQGWDTTLIRLDLATGDTAPVEGMPTLNDGTRFVRTDRSLLVDTGTSAYRVDWYSSTAGRITTPGRPVTATSDRDNAWYATDGPHRGSRIRAYDSVRAIGPAVRLAPTASLIAATPRGLLLSERGSIRLWDPDTGRTVRRFADVVAVTPGTVVTSDHRCVARCAMTATDLRSLESHQLTMTRGRFDPVLLSDDGVWLAEAVFDPAGRGPIQRFEVEHMQSGHTFTVPGYTPSADHDRQLRVAWSSDEELVITESYTFDGRARRTIGLWQVGDADLHIALRDAWRVNFEFVG